MSNDNNDCSLDGHYLAGIHLDAQEHGIALDEGSAVQQFVGDEAREAESKLIGLVRGTLEVLPGGIRHKGLRHASLATLGALFEQREGDGVREGPLQQGIVLSGQDLYVDGHVGILAGTIAIEEHRGLQLVAILGGVEGR